jgi:hypothetical protein
MDAYLKGVLLGLTESGMSDFCRTNLNNRRNSLVWRVSVSESVWRIDLLQSDVFLTFVYIIAGVEYSADERAY